MSYFSIYEFPQRAKSQKVTNENENSCSKKNLVEQTYKAPLNTERWHDRYVAEWEKEIEWSRNIAYIFRSIYLERSWISSKRLESTREDSIQSSASSFRRSQKIKRICSKEGVWARKIDLRNVLNKGFLPREMTLEMEHKTYSTVVENEKKNTDKKAI